MASVNKVIIVGNLGRDPETRYNPEGGAITNISVATTDTWKDKASGEKQERTEWHRVVFFNRLAEIAGEYLKKGSQVYVEGSLRTRKWKDKEGQERTTTEIVADRMQMLGSRQGSGDARARGEGAGPRGRSDARQEAGGQVRRHGRRHSVLAARRGEALVQEGAERHSCDEHQRLDARRGQRGDAGSGAVAADSPADPEYRRAGEEPPVHLGHPGEVEFAFEDRLLALQHEAERKHRHAHCATENEREARVPVAGHVEEVEHLLRVHHLRDSEA